MAGLGESTDVEDDAMTDVVKIARECRATLAAEIARLDDFIRMAEALKNYGQRLKSDPAIESGGLMPVADLADLDHDGSSFADCETVRDGEAVTATPVSEVAAAGRDGSGILFGPNSAHDEAPMPRTDLASTDPDHFAFDGETSVNADELVLMDPLSSDPGSVDIHIGQRLRQRRWMMGMSQQQLGDIIGVKFDQIQKYETGANRISVRCMWDIAAALEVPVSYFFDNLEGQAVDTGETRSDILTDEEAHELVGNAPSVRIA